MKAPLEKISRFGKFKTGDGAVGFNDHFTFHPSLLTSSKSAFTLAEVLITLGIIGIVAAMTLPTLVAKYKDKELATRTQKAVSAIQQAAQLAQSAYGTPGDNSSLFDITKSSEEVTQNFAKYFNGSKYCEPDTGGKECTGLHYKIKYSSRFESIGGGTVANGQMYYSPRIVLNDGTIVSVDQQDSDYREDDCQQWNEDGSLGDTTTCKSYYIAIIRFDVNGNQSPNQFGRDAFQMLVYKNKIEPGGASFYGVPSLRSILSGGDAIYTNYQLGEPFEW